MSAGNADSAIMLSKQLPLLERKKKLTSKFISNESLEEASIGDLNEEDD